MTDVDGSPGEAGCTESQDSGRDARVPAGDRDLGENGVVDDGVGGPEHATAAADVSDPIPEADSAETEEAWEESESMEGEAPTG